MKDYNLQVIYANIDNMLIRSQTKLEETITAYGKAHDEYSILFGEYRLAKAEAVKKLKNEGHAVTIIQDLANGLVAAKKAELLQADGKVKKLKMLVDAFTERIQGIKFIGKKTEVMTK
jgi:hypothetical protein